MLSLLENVEKSVEPLYTFGSNALSHGRHFVSFLADSLTFISSAFSALPSFVIPVITLAVGVGVTVHVLRW